MRTDGLATERKNRRIRSILRPRELACKNPAFHVFSLHESPLHFHSRNYRPAQAPAGCSRQRRIGGYRTAPPGRGESAGGGRRDFIHGTISSACEGQVWSTGVIQEIPMGILKQAS